MLMPHSKTDVKVSDKRALSAINEMADLKNCTNCLYFEGRKKVDLYLWMCRTPQGPSVKFHVTNVHTMAELKFTGNCLKGSRPIVCFDKSFDDANQPQLMLIKELFSQTFSTPKMHPKSKPFVDHIVMFSYFENRIWYRNYQIVDEYHADNPKKMKEEKTLVEIGPRFVMNVISVFAGSFGGELLYKNPDYVTPNAIRRASKTPKKNYGEELQKKQQRSANEQKWAPKKDFLDNVFQVESMESVSDSDDSDDDDEEDSDD
jgi:ribosome biogenesis protein BRX1